MLGSNEQIGVLPPPRRLLARLLIAATLVPGVLHWFGGSVAALTAPLVKAEIEWLAPQFTVVSAGVGHDHSSSDQFRLVAYNSKPIAVGRRVLLPSNWATGKPTDALEIVDSVAGIFAPGIAALILVVTWPAGIKELLYRCLLVFPLAMPFVLLDVAAWALGDLWCVVRHDLGLSDFGGWTFLYRILRDGGAVVLGAASGVAAVFIAGRTAAVFALAVSRLRLGLRQLQRRELIHHD
jgi:hypothetical protein